MSDQVDEEYKSTFSVSWIKRFFSRIAFNILGTFWEFLIPIIQYSSLLVLMMIFSVVGYYLLNSALLPEALMSEPLYFDFSQTAPIAKLNMLSREKQWKYTAECMSVNRKQFVRGRENLSTTSNPQTPEEIDAMRSRMMDALRADSMRCSGLSRKRFLKAGFRYTIDVMFGLASSPKNLVLGKFMVHTKVIDSAGDTVATSSRPVAVPYQSHATLLLDAVVKYPLRAVGILPTSEVTDVVVPVMNEFREPFEMVTASTMSGNTLTTEYLELKLSSADVDIDYAFVTVMPLLSGIT